MSETPTKIPDFQQPIETVSPVIESLFHSKIYEENGIQFSAYKPINALDPLELSKNSRSCTFYYKDANAFINTKRAFLDITWNATQDDGKALTHADYVSCLNPSAHNLIKSVTINIGTYFQYTYKYQYIFITTYFPIHLAAFYYLRRMHYQRKSFIRNGNETQFYDQIHQSSTQQFYQRTRRLSR